jgi:hypothetical protein
MRFRETAPSNLIQPEAFRHVDSKAERFASASRVVAELPLGHPFPWVDRERRIAALEALTHQAPSDCFVLRLRWPGNDDPVHILVGQRSKTAAEDAKTGTPCRNIERRLDSWLAMLWPEVRLAKHATPLPRLPFRSVVRPLAASSPEIEKLGPRTLSVRRTTTSIVDHPERRRFDISSALAVLAPYAPSELVLRLSPVFLDASAMRTVRDLEQHWMALAIG